MGIVSRYYTTSLEAPDDYSTYLKTNKAMPTMAISIDNIRLKLIIIFPLILRFLRSVIFKRCIKQASVMASGRQKKKF